jgi:predicted nucleic acid-binding protein
MVVDASAGVDMLLGRLASDDRALLMAADLRAPDLIMVEVLSALTSMRRRGLQSDADVARGLYLLDRLPIDLVTTRALVAEAAPLTDRVSAYDACYVVLAAIDDSPLATTDRKLARTHDLPVEIVSLTPLAD